MRSERPKKSWLDQKEFPEAADYADLMTGEFCGKESFQRAAESPSSPRRVCDRTGVSRSPRRVRPVADEAPAHRRAGSVLPRLKPLLQRHIPDAPPDIGLPRVVAIKAVTRSSDKRRVLIKHIVHPERDGGIIQPCVPTR